MKRPMAATLCRLGLVAAAMTGCGAPTPAVATDTKAGPAGATGEAGTYSPPDAEDSAGSTWQQGSGAEASTVGADEDTGDGTASSGPAGSTSTGAQGYHWEVSIEPPDLLDPLVVTLPDARYLEQVPAYGLLCAGQRYTVRPEPSQDVLVLFEGEEPLAFPLGILGGRNVIIRGLEMSLQVQPGCEAGALANGGPNPDPPQSVHPRSPAGVALHVQQSGVTFIEGTFLDLNGHETDCIVGRNPAEMTNAVAKTQRDIVIQNFACHGIEGHSGGVHGDLYQNQGEDLSRLVALENVTVRTSQEGLVLHQWGGLNTGMMEIRRYDYDVDERFIDDDAYDNQLGVIFDASADEFVIEDAWLNIGLWGRVNGTMLGEVDNGQVVAHPGVHVGDPEIGEFAVPENLGRYYVSPHQ